MTRYAALELLAKRPGLSNSELARGAFVSRESMNVLLQSLERAGVVTRPADAPVGKTLPTRITPLGRRQLAKATVAVKAVEDRMLAGLDAASRQEARHILRGVVGVARLATLPHPGCCWPTSLFSASCTSLANQGAG